MASGSAPLPSARTLCIRLDTARLYFADVGLDGEIAGSPALLTGHWDDSCHLAKLQLRWLSLSFGYGL